MTDGTAWIPDKGNGELIAKLNQYRVAYLVVGGAAVAVHGCRDWVDVDDLDLLVEPTIENGARVVGALVAAGIQVPLSGDRFARPGVQIPLKVMQFWAELLTPEEDIVFGDLMERSVPGVVGQYSVRVIGKADLTHMKERAVERLAGELEKHQHDLDRLRAV